MESSALCPEARLMHACGDSLKPAARWPSAGSMPVRVILESGVLTAKCDFSGLRSRKRLEAVRDSVGADAIFCPVFP